MGAGTKTKSRYHPKEGPLFSWRWVLPAPRTPNSELPGLLPARRPHVIQGLPVSPPWSGELSAYSLGHPSLLPDTPMLASRAPSFPPRISAHAVPSLPSPVTARSNLPSLRGTVLKNISPGIRSEFKPWLCYLGKLAQPLWDSVSSSIKWGY